MLKTSYPTQDAIPDNQKGAYIERDGKWILDDYDSDHPLVKKRDELLTKVAKHDEALDEVNTKLEVALKRQVPSGKKVVDSDVAKLGEAAKQAGLTEDELPKIITERDELKKDKEARDSESVLEKAAGSAEITNVDAFKKLDAARKLRFETTTVNGETKYQVIQTVDGKDVKNDFTREWVEKNEDLKPFTAAFYSDPGNGEGNGNGSGGGIKFPVQKPTTKPGSKGDQFDKIRENMEKQQKAKVPAADFSAAFNRRKTGDA